MIFLSDTLKNCYNFKVNIIPKHQPKKKLFHNVKQKRGRENVNKWIIPDGPSIYSIFIVTTKLFPSDY